MAEKTTEARRARIELDEFDRALLSSDPAAEEAAQILQDAGRSPYASSDDATIAGVWDLDPANGVFEAPADMPERVPRAVSIDGGPEFGAWAAATSDGRVEENEAGCVAARFDLATALRVADWINSLSGEESIRFDPAVQAFLEYDGNELVAASPADEWGLYEVSPGAIWDDSVPDVPPEYPADALRPDLVSRREGLARQADMRTRTGDAQLRALTRLRRCASRWRTEASRSSTSRATPICMSRRRRRYAPTSAAASSPGVQSWPAFPPRSRERVSPWPTPWTSS